MLISNLLKIHSATKDAMFSSMSICLEYYKVKMDVLNYIKSIIYMIFHSNTIAGEWNLSMFRIWVTPLKLSCYLFLPMS